MIILAVAAAALPASMSASATTFPPAFRGTWAGNPESCETELTNGFVIDARSIRHYDGPSVLVSHGPVTRLKTPLGRGYSMPVTVKAREGRRTWTENLRLTLAGGFLYYEFPKAAAGGKRFSKEDRHVKCGKLRETAM